MSIEEHGTAQETLLPRQQFGRYEIVGLLGSGGFAAVYEALDPALDATVAVKVLGDNHCLDPDVRSRFIKEARLLRRVGTDRLVPVFDIGEQAGQPYFVMELIKGGTLADRITEQSVGPEPIDHGSVRRIVIELAECLDAVHRAGIVHRDLKPSNILIRRSADGDRSGAGRALLDGGEQLVLGDFGIAREVDASNLTMAVGTVGFMAPEQRTPSASIDQRADIYAATAIVAMLLTSVGPATPHGPASAADPTGGHGPVGTGGGTVARGADALSPELRAALARGMATDPDGRPSTAAEWRAMMLYTLPAEEGRTRYLSPVAVAGPIRSMGPAFEVGLPGVTDPADGSAPGDRQWPRPRPAGARLPAPGVMVAVLAAVLAVVVGGVALLMAIGGGQPRIVGPETIRVGQPVVYRAETSPGAEHYWTDWNGVRHDEDGLRVEPSGAGVLPIALTELVDGRQRTETLVIKVLE